jgi:hypothetical protein
MISLVSNEVEYATAADVRLVPSETGLPYEIIVQTDLTGPVWTLQLREPVGVVDLTSWNDAMDPFAPDLSAVPVERRGLKILERTDTRWSWKEAELSDLQEITFDCVTSLAEELEPLVDPALLTAPLSGDDPWEALERMTGLIDFMVREGLSLPAETLEAAGPPADARVWPAGLGIDVSNALSSLSSLAFESGDTKTPLPASVSVEPRRTRRPTDDPLSELLRSLASSNRRSRRILSSEALWQAGELPQEVLARLGKRGLLRLTPIPVS